MTRMPAGAEAVELRNNGRTKVCLEYRRQRSRTHPKHRTPKTARRSLNRSNAVDLHERISWNAACGGDRRPDRRLGAETAHDRLRSCRRSPSGRSDTRSPSDTLSIDEPTDSSRFSISSSTCLVCALMSPSKCAPMPAMNTMLPSDTMPLKSGVFSGGLPLGVMHVLHRFLAGGGLRLRGRRQRDRGGDDGGLREKLAAV